MACTKREWDVIRLLETGHDRAQIAAELDLSPSTVRTYINDLCTTLDCTQAQIPHRARLRNYIPDTSYPDSGRCIVCGDPITSTPRHGDPDGFCKSACAKEFFGTQALSGPVHKATGPAPKAAA